MKLSWYSRAFSLVAALSIASAVIVTVAEIGHPPEDGIGAVASLFLRSGAEEPPAALVSAVEP